MIGLSLSGEKLFRCHQRENRHELIKSALNRYWTRKLLDAVCLVTETTLHVNDDTFHEPDFLFYLAADGLINLPPLKVPLIVELSDSSLSFDLNRKVPLYAGYGIRETWVIDANTLVTHVHRHPGNDGYRDILQVTAD